jgi:hypothetical protein
LDFSYGEWGSRSGHRRRLTTIPIVGFFVLHKLISVSRGQRRWLPSPPHYEDHYLRKNSPTKRAEQENPGVV